MISGDLSPPARPSTSSPTSTTIGWKSKAARSASLSLLESSSWPNGSLLSWVTSGAVFESARLKTASDIGSSPMSIMNGECVETITCQSVFLEIVLNAALRPRMMWGVHEQFRLLKQDNRASHSRGVPILPGHLGFLGGQRFHQGENQRPLQWLTFCKARKEFR